MIIKEKLIIVLKRLLFVPYIKYLNYRLTFKYNRKYEHRKYLGIDYKVIRGTIRLKNDYDEAWVLFLSQRSKIVFDIYLY